MKLCRLETFLLEKQCPAMWVAKPYYSNNTLLSLCNAIAKNVCSIGPLCPQLFCNSPLNYKIVTAKSKSSRTSETIEVSLHSFDVKLEKLINHVRQLHSD
jgi:hypothetical protein